MEESYRRGSPLSPVNPASESCTAELTRSNSGEFSLTVENFKFDLLQSGNATTDKCMRWTNEKHNTLLDSLETSFVQQLHRSMVLCAGRAELKRSSRNKKLYTNNDKVDKKFTAWRDGCWKINIESDQPELLVRQGDEYHHIMDLQLCSRLYTERDKRTSSHGLEERLDLLLPIPAELQKPVSRIAEGSGQNFVEDFEENLRSKNLKTAMTGTANNEQIVPTGKFESPGIANSMFQRKEEVNLEC